MLMLRGLCETRKIAQSLILEGKVRVDGQVVSKSGTAVADNSEIVLEKPSCPYVSRGGIKLEHALAQFKIDVNGNVALDIGASTGGFTHCLLMKGALKVYAVDVGRGQLDYRLRNNPAVVCLEKRNARYLSAGDVSESVDIITIDISFISLTKVLERARGFLKDSGCLIALVKPQFEAGRRQVKKGVVRDPAVHREVVLRILDFAGACSLCCRGMTYSPIKGPSGNIEFFLIFEKGEGKTPGGEEVDRMVEEAHHNLMRAV